MNTTDEMTETLADMMVLAYAHLTSMAALSASDGDEDENGFSPNWELAKRYYRARELVAAERGLQPFDILHVGDCCKWAKARRDEIGAPNE